MPENLRSTFDPHAKLTQMLQVWEDPQNGGTWKTGDLLNFLGARGVNNELFHLSDAEKLEVTQAIIKQKPEDALAHRQLLHRWLTKPMALERDYHIRYLKAYPHYAVFFEDENFDDGLHLGELAREHGLV